MPRITSHHQLTVYKKAMDAAMRVFAWTRTFPKEETYSLTDQVRRSSRAVCAMIGEAWRRRRYEAAFVNKLNESEAEAAETQVWIEFAVKCGYLTGEAARPVYELYDEVLAILVSIIKDPSKWIINKEKT